MTDTDMAAIGRIVTQADGLADEILTTEVPDVARYRALAGLINWGRGSGCFEPSDLHLRALQRLPEATALQGWRRQEVRLASVRGA